MADLNSVIVEGTVEERTKDCVKIVSERDYKRNGEIEKESSYIDILIDKKCEQYYDIDCKVGDKIRVVGRLKYVAFKWYTKIYVVAEYIGKKL